MSDFSRLGRLRQGTQQKQRFTKKQLAQIHSGKDPETIASITGLPLATVQNELARRRRAEMYIGHNQQGPRQDRYQ